MRRLRLPQRTLVAAVIDAERVQNTGVRKLLGRRPGLGGGADARAPIGRGRTLPHHSLARALRRDHDRISMGRAQRLRDLERLLRVRYRAKLVTG